MTFALAQTEGPIYLHCYIGRTSTAALQFWRARLAKDVADGGAANENAIVKQSGKSITQTAMIEAAYHGIDIGSWEAIIAREAGETVNVAAVAAVTTSTAAVTAGCDVVL